MIPGIYPNLSNEEYHASAGISRSGIMEFRKTPKHYWHRYLNPNYVSKPKSSALKFGGALHPFILEPDKFEEEYCIIPKFDRRTSIGKTQYAHAVLSNQNKTILDKEQYDLIKGIRASLFADDDARELLIGARYEHSIYWIDPETQLLCKVRPDIWHNNFIVDLKTTKDASEKSFSRDFYAYGYHLQLGMMHEASKHILENPIRNFIDLAVEKLEPFLHAIYPISEEAIDYGIKEFHQNLQQLKVCLDTNNWPGYPIETLKLPKYLR